MSLAAHTYPCPGFLKHGVYMETQEFRAIENIPIRSGILEQDVPERYDVQHLISYRADRWIPILCVSIGVILFAIAVARQVIRWIG
jgi:hypothetical protein